jgi:hypothetical protein
MLAYFAVATAAITLAAVSSLVVRKYGSRRILDGQARPRRLLWTPFDFAAVAVLVAFSALRFEVGTDFPMYARMFAALDPAAEWGAQIATSSQEVGYTTLSLLVRSVVADPLALLWVTAVITVVPVYAVIKKKSTNVALAVALYVLLAFYVAPFNLIRQGIAVSLTFWAYSFLGRKGGWVIFAALALLASTFHVSALIAAILMIVARLWRPTKLSVVVALAGSVAAAGALLTLPSIQQFAVSLNERYETYLSNQQVSGVGTYLNVVALIMLLWLAMWLGAGQSHPDWLAMLTLAAALLIVGTQAVVVGRIYYYFGIFAILLLPNLLAKRENSKTLSFALVAASTVYFAFYLQFFGGLLPYRTSIEM